MPPKNKVKKLRVPKDTVSDISAYAAQVAADIDAGAVLASTSTDGSSYSSSSGSSYSRGRRYGGNVLPPDPSSPRVRMVEEFTRRTAEEGDWLQKWYSENYEKVQNYEYIRFELLYFLTDYMQGIRVDEDINPLNLVEMVKEVITDLATKFNRFNLQLVEISGHEIAGYMKDHHRKVMEVVEDYENKIKSANEEIAQCKEHIAHLDAELTAARTREMYLERGTAYSGGLDDSVTEEEFMADLQSRVAHAEKLNSSMKEELEREKQQKEGLQSQVDHLSKEQVEIEEQCMQKIAELSQRAEIYSMLERGIESMLQKEDKKPNKEDCQKLIDQWKNEINQAIDQNSKEIDELLKKVEGQNNELAKLQAQVKEQDEQLEQKQTQVKNGRSLFDKLKEEASYLRTQIDEVKKAIEELHNESIGLEARYGEASAGEDETMDINWTLEGEMPEHELLANTLPLRGRGRSSRRPATPPFTESSEGPSSPDQPPLPRGGWGVIRLEDNDQWVPVGGGQITTSSNEDSSQGGGSMDQVQWTTHAGRVIPVVPAHRQPTPSPRRARQVGPAQHQQVQWITRGGRIFPVVQDTSHSQSIESPGETEQTGPAEVPQQVQWTTRGGRIFPVVQEPSPRQPVESAEETEQTGPVEVPQQVQWTTRGGRIIPIEQEPSPWQQVASPREPAAPRPRTPTRQDATAMPLTTQRAGTARRLGASGPGLATPRVTSRVGPSGMRPAASRPGTPPRPRIPNQRPTAQRTRTPRSRAIPSPRPTAARGRTPQRRGTPSTQPAVPTARTPQRRNISSMRPEASSPADRLSSRVRVLSPQRPEASIPSDRLSSRVLLLSPQRSEPLALDVDLVPQDIVPMDNQFVCEIAVGIQAAAVDTERRNAPRGGRGGRGGRRQRPHFTPRTGFQR